MKEFLAVLFASRDYAHKLHLNTESYAQHQALGGFYKDVVDLGDGLAEAWMGYNQKKVGEIPTYESKSGGKPAVVLKRHLTELEKMCGGVCGDSTALKNMVDEITSLYLSTIYKLTFLG